MGQKLDGAVPFLWGGELGPYRTQSPGPKPASIPSGILVHPAIWPQPTLTEIGGGYAPVGEGS